MLYIMHGIQPSWFGIFHVFFQKKILKELSMMQCPHMNILRRYSPQGRHYDIFKDVHDKKYIDNSLV